ncbi:MAG: hypothetical protein Q9180_007773, partial [Flavoplaca navasiana]
MRQRRILKDTLYQRGINPRNPRLTLRQVLRVTRGYDKGAPDPTPSAAELQQAAAPAPAPATAFAPQLPPAPQQAQLPPAPGGAFSQAGPVMGEDQFGGGRRGGYGMGPMGGDGSGGGPAGGMGGRRHGGRRNHEQFGGRDGMFLGGGWRGGRGGRQGPPSWVHEDDEEEMEDDVPALTMDNINSTPSPEPASVAPTAIAQLTTSQPPSPATTAPLNTRSNKRKLDIEDEFTNKRLQVQPPPESTQVVSPESSEVNPHSQLEKQDHVPQTEIDTRHHDSPTQEPRQDQPTVAQGYSRDHDQDDQSIRQTDVPDHGTGNRYHERKYQPS